MMQISAANIGQVLRFDHRPIMIRIEDVSDKFITYSNENGHRFGMENRDLRCSVVQDEELVKEFERNFTLGHALNAAEQSALHKLLLHKQGEEEYLNAARVLEETRQMQSRLELRIQERIDLEVREEARSRRDPAHDQSRHEPLENVIHSAQMRSGKAQPGTQPQKEKAEQER